MSHKSWQHQAAHMAHFALHTETGKHAVKTAATTLAAAAPAAVVLAGTAATAVALPAVVIGAVGYGLYRLLKS